MNQLSEKEWIDLLSSLSLGDVNDRPRFVAYDECYGLSRYDCAKMAAQLVRHFAPMFRQKMAACTETITHSTPKDPDTFEFVEVEYRDGKTHFVERQVPNATIQTAPSGARLQSLVGCEPENGEKL